MAEIDISWLVYVVHDHHLCS